MSNAFFKKVVEHMEKPIIHYTDIIDPTIIDVYIQLLGEEALEGDKTDE